MGSVFLLHASFRGHQLMHMYREGKLDNAHIAGIIMSLDFGPYAQLFLGVSWH
jgi:hypothetical protein